MEDKRKELLKELHHAKISQITSKDGKGRKDRTRWSTWVSDETKKTGQRQIRSSSKERFYQLLFEHYGLKESSKEKITISLKGLYDKWIKHRQATVTLSTVKKDMSIWKKYYAGDPITDRSLNTIKPSEATAWLSNILKENKLTRRQYYEMRGVWKSIEEYAFINDLITKRIILYLGNPADSLFAPEPVKHAETAVFFPDEINLVADKARELYQKSHFNTAYLGLALDNYLGFRVGELSCLRWNDIDRTRKYITIRQSEVSLYEVTEEGNIRNHGYEVVDHLKKGHPERGVPMPPEAEEVLDYIRSENEKHGIDSEYVFVQQNGDRVHTRAFHKAIKKVYAELGWTDYKTAGIHEFRRTYATTIIGKIDDKKVQGYMGHNDWGTTKRYYQIVKQRPDLSDAEAISRAFQQA